LSLEIEQTLLERMIESGRQHYPKEFGGLLVGYYSDDKKTACITDFVVSQHFQSSPASFLRGDEGLHEVLDMYYRQTPSQIYLGERHTHPHGRPMPSKVALAAMSAILQSDTVLITSPILFIMGLFPKSAEFVFYLFHSKELIRLISCDNGK